MEGGCLCQSVVHWVLLGLIVEERGTYLVLDVLASELDSLGLALGRQGFQVTVRRLPDGSRVFRLREGLRFVGGLPLGAGGFLPVWCFVRVLGKDLICKLHL